tara:strand:- start:981 stop:1199 length:219 start_codon:yes stop_codon:yes gene_type:complete
MIEFKTIQEEIVKDYKSLLKEYKQVNTLTEINSIIKKCNILKSESFYYNIDIYISVNAILIAMQEKKNLLTN